MTARSIALFVAAALAEISGAYLTGSGYERAKARFSWRSAVLSSRSTESWRRFQPSHEFGRVLAAYGGVFTVGSLLWGIAFDGFHPDTAERVGPRPHDPTAREPWDRAAAHLDDYRNAFGQLPGDALPDRGDYRARHAWEEVHKDAAKALEIHPERPLVEHPPPQLSHDIGLSIDL